MRTHGTTFPSNHINSIKECYYSFANLFAHHITSAKSHQYGKNSTINCVNLLLIEFNHFALLNPWRPQQPPQHQLQPQPQMQSA